MTDDLVEKVGEAGGLKKLAVVVADLVKRVEELEIEVRTLKHERKERKPTSKQRDS